MRKVPQSEGNPTQHNRGKKRWLSIILVLVLTVVTVCGVGVWHHRQQHEQAFASCQREQKHMQETYTRWQQEREQALQLQTIQPEEVIESESVSTFRAAVKNEPKTLQGNCKASDSTADLEHAVLQYQQTQQSSQKQAKELQAAVKKLLRSRDAKVLSDGKAALQAKSDEGSKLLADSEGKVADNACRESLRQAVVDAGKASASSVVADVDKARLNVQGAIDAVNANMQAKATADAQAATAAQAAVPAPSWTQTQKPAPSYTQPQGHRNYQAPAAPTPAPAPAPAAPAPSTSSGNGVSPSVNDWMNQIGQPVCVKGQACGIG
ncbi:hypothetical protein BOCO_1207 [Bombiscardovia coagulans]|uniref:Colicin transporter n=2 Tax=Bombiscardovia coagulans TaxID=686666 RepID=A0A261EQ45_9BIFI|nr:hypothetical protein BOCO_1207 [Bombiscardovia coagulans]